MTQPIIPSLLARRSSPPAISELMKEALGNPRLISLAAGFVDQASLPIEETLKTVDAILSDPVEGRRALQYGTTQGDPKLRWELARLLERNDGEPEGSLDGLENRIVVTTGSNQFLYLLSEALLDPGDIVIVESPTYFVYLGILESRGARAFGVETDSGGMRLDSLEAALSGLERRGELNRVKLVYTISYHSNPTGLSLAEDRRGPLVELVRGFSKKHRIFVLEDAAYRGLNYSGTEPRSIRSYDREGDTVILARSFSKTYSPGMKTGFAAVPEDLLRCILDLKGNHDFGSSHFHQQLLAKLLAEGAYDRQVDRLVHMYRRKRDAFLEALREGFVAAGDDFSWTRPSGGMFVWISGPAHLDLGRAGPVFPKALEAGVLYVPGQLAFPSEPESPRMNHARLCFGVPDEVDLIEGAARLARAFSSVLSRAV